MDIRTKKWEILCNEEELSQVVSKLGNTITKDYENKKLLIISILKGAMFFTSDLTKNIKIPTKIDFMMTSSYGDGKINLGEVKILKDIDYSLEGYDVIIVDDVLDTAITMDFLIKHLKKKNPESIKSCVLFNKQAGRKVDLSADYVGMEIEDKFLVGYGLDYGDFYRNIPYVFCVLNEDR